MNRLLLVGFLFVYSNEVAVFSQPNSLSSTILSHFTYRNIGPFRPGAWVVDMAVPESPEQAHLYTIYVATRNGGSYKTTNNGVTWKSIFHQEEVHALGAVALSPSHPEHIWLGTGDSYYARSSYSGNGVYRSTDGGSTWRHCGLDESHHIGKIIVHPKDPNTVYVAAMGHLFGPNQERGVFKTTDAGLTWSKVLYINENVGIVDMAIQPDNPNILYAAAYEKYRYAWTFEAGGPGSGIYKTTNAGKTWHKLGGGLPDGKLGRIGLDVCRSKSSVVYAVIENLNLRDPLPKEIQEETSRGITPKPREIAGEVYRSMDAGKTWSKMNRPEDNVGGKAAYSFNTIRVAPDNADLVYVTGINLQHSTDGGRNWHGVEWRDTSKIFGEAFGDVRTAWIDHQNPNRILMGSDGGLHLSYDRGLTCDHYGNLPVGEVYAIGLDKEEPYNVYAGLQDHDSWKGPSNGWSGIITQADWLPVGPQDGMYNQADPADSRWIYNTYQFGGHARVDQSTGERFDIEPRRERNQTPYRWNWTPPLRLSPHNSHIIYTGAEVLLRSLDQGNHWQEISPDLTTNDPTRINGKGNIQFCTITTISESPVKPGVIWVGTDDGRVWVTQNHGAHWQDVTLAAESAGAPAGKWVSRVFASHHDPAVAYITKTGFREDDFKPYVLKTADYGKSWSGISEGLPDKPVNVIVEDNVNPNLLFLGNDHGVYISLNAGSFWHNFNNNIPTVPVHDLAIHPRDKDLVVGTYGRGIFITDIAPLQQWKQDILNERLYLFDIEAKPYLMTGTRGANYHLYGDRHLTAPNEFNGGTCYFYWNHHAVDSAHVTLSDVSGKELKKWIIPAKKGLNLWQWDFRIRQEGRRPAQLVEPGQYIITIGQEDQKISKTMVFTKKIGWNIGMHKR